MNLEDVALNGRKPVTERQISCDSSQNQRAVKFTETEHRMLTARGWIKQGPLRDSFKGTTSIWEDEKVLEGDGGDGCLAR